MSQPSRSVSLSSPLGWVAALALALLTVFGLAIAAPGLESGAYVPDGTGLADVVTVPNVVGDPLPSARQQLEQRGFEVSVTSAQDDAARGIVIDQSPRAETGAPAGATVHLSVSAPPPPPPPTTPSTLTHVPHVEGLSLAEAEDRIEAEDLNPVVADELPSPLSLGTVVDSEPEAGERVEEGSTVALSLASGSNDVPSVVGLARDAAEQHMRDAGFAVTFAEIETETETETVTGQSESPGTSLELGSTIELTVAIPSPTITESPTESPTPTPTPTPAPGQGPVQHCVRGTVDPACA